MTRTDTYIHADLTIPRKSRRARPAWVCWMFLYPSDQCVFLINTRVNSVAIKPLLIKLTLQLPGVIITGCG